MKNQISPWLCMICMILIVFVHLGPANAESESKKGQYQADDHSLNESSLQHSKETGNTEFSTTSYRWALPNKARFNSWIDEYGSQNRLGNISILSSRQSTIKDFNGGKNTYLSGAWKGAAIGGIIGFSLGLVWIAFSAIFFQPASFTDEDDPFLGFWIIAIVGGALLGLIFGAIFS